MCIAFGGPVLDETSEFMGVWWLPDSPEDRVQGTLQLLEGNTGRLRAVGRLPSLNGESAPVVLGETTSGERITLLDARFSRQPMSWSDRIGIFEAVPRRVLVGAHFQDREKVEFRSLLFEMPGFLRWFAPKLSLDPEEEEGRNRVIVSLQGECPSKVQLSCRGATGSFLVRGPFAAKWSLLGNDEVVIKQTAGVQIEFAEERPEAEFWERVGDFQVFFAFWLGGPVYLQEVWAQGVAGKRFLPGGGLHDSWIRVIDQTARTPETVETGRYLFGALLSYADLGERFPALWDGWGRVSERYKSVLDLYTATLYGEGRQYAINQFLALAQALEIFHRIKYGGTYIEPSLFKREVLPGLLAELAKCTENKFAEIAARKVLSLNALDLRSRIEELVDRHKAVVWFRIGREGFAADVTNTRNYLTHRSESLQSKSKDGVALSFLTFRCQFLLEILILSELGFSEADLEGLVVHHVQHGRWIGLDRYRWDLGREGVEA